MTYAELCAKLTKKDKLMLAVSEYVQGLPIKEIEIRYGIGIESILKEYERQKAYIK